MSILQHHHQPHVPRMLPGGTRAVVEGVAALITLVALVAALCGITTWAVVEVVRAFL